MFSSKKQNLIDTSSKKGTKNKFLQTAQKNTARIVSNKGAVKFASTDSPFVNQFTKTSGYKIPRSYEQVSRDMSELWAVNPLDAVKFIIYLRTINRKTQLFSGETTEESQIGEGLRNESIFRMLWLAINHEETFWKNLPIFISVGRWKDVFDMLRFDLQFHGWEQRVLNWNMFYAFILQELQSESQVNLVKKYLPAIRTGKKYEPSKMTLYAQSNLLISKWLCSQLFGNKKEGDYSGYKKYRKLKSSGTAHTWQQAISRKEFDKLDFGSIHGKALNLLVRSKFLFNQGLSESYKAWIDSQKRQGKTTLKYTGYPHELFMKGATNFNTVETINMQFMELVEKAKLDRILSNNGLIPVLDTSGSMSSQAHGVNMSCRDLSRAIGLFLSYSLPKGDFNNHWIEFNSTAMMKQWVGSTPYEKYTNDRAGYIGSTNFQSVIDLFIKIKRSGVSENEFPSGIVCISDGEFDVPSSRTSSYSPGEGRISETNFKVAKKKLSQYFSKEYVDKFIFVFWNLQHKPLNFSVTGNAGDKFETYDTGIKNVYYMSGFAPAKMNFLTTGQKPKTASELVAKALDQEVLNMVEL